ncbi:hemerythrin domain-containing protein [Ferdinandcohnia sp. SAFN-114]|uniref:hemerythrin domain-containing protein n=1 Tax=Ferdinandcohnia sp. SAFN-114 TaxID=3387275 RepID=UPI003F7DDF9B
MLIEDQNVKLLSPPLQKLKDEHESLRAMMNRFYEIAEEIEYKSGPKVLELFSELYKQISSFNIELNAHSKREDEGLFPMMDRRLGDKDQTIGTMEYEHRKAEKHLRDFLDEAALVGEDMDEYDAQTITVYAVQAYATLTQHFAKEENMLFPLAERILSTEEKAELERLLRN